MKRTKYIFIALCLYTFIQTSFSDWMDITPSGLKNTVGDTMGVTFGDGDGVVSVQDIIRLISAWGDC